MEAASKFQSRAMLQNLYLPHFGITSTLVILVFGAMMFTPHLFYSMRILLSDYVRFEGDKAILSLISFLIMIISLLLTYRWFRPLAINRIEVNMKNLIILGLVTYALSLIWTNSYDLVFFSPRWYLSQSSLIQNLKSLKLSLKIITGFILLKLTSNIVHGPVLNEENTKLLAQTLGGMTLTGLTAAFTLIIDNRIYPTDIYVIMVLKGISLITSCAALGLLAYDIFKQRRVRYQKSLTVLYLWLILALFDYILLNIHRVKLGVDLQLLLHAFIRKPSLTDVLNLPIGFATTVLIVLGIVIHRSGLGTSRSLKAIYSFAIITSAFPGIYSARNLPIALDMHLKDVGNLISIQGINLAPKLPYYTVWLCLIYVFQGFIILAFGVLCIREPKVTVDDETPYPFKPRPRLDRHKLVKPGLTIKGARSWTRSLFTVMLVGAGSMVIVAGFLYLSGFGQAPPERHFYLDDISITLDGQVIFEDDITNDSMISDKWDTHKYVQITNETYHSPPYGLALTCSYSGAEGYGKLYPSVNVETGWESMNVTWFVKVPEMQWPRKEVSQSLALLFWHAEKTGIGRAIMGCRLRWDYSRNGVPYIYMYIDYFGEPKIPSKQDRRQVLCEYDEWHKISLVLHDTHAVTYLDDEIAGEIEFIPSQLTGGIDFLWITSYRNP